MFFLFPTEFFDALVKGAADERYFWAHSSSSRAWFSSLSKTVTFFYHSFPDDFMNLQIFLFAFKFFLSYYNSHEWRVNQNLWLLTIWIVVGFMKRALKEFAAVGVEVWLTPDPDFQFKTEASIKEWLT